MNNSIKNSFKIAFLFLGMFVGAGFCTGQETFQYFNRNNGNLLSLAFALFLLILNFYIVLKKIYEDRIDSFDEYVTKTSSKVIGRIFKIFISIIAFVAFFGMHSAAGSLFKQIFKTSNSYTAGVLTLSFLCFIVFILDAKGLLMVNSFMSPLKIIGIPILTLIAIKKGNISLFHDKSFLKELSLPSGLFTFFNSFVSAACYVSFNAIASGSVLVSFKNLFDKKTIKLGAILGGTLICVMHLVIWLAFKLHFKEIEKIEIPMLYFANTIGGICKIIYLILVCSGTFTTAVSMGFALINQFKIKDLKQRLFYSILLCIIALPLAFIKFSSIIGKIFGFMGYVGFAWMFITIFDYLKNIMPKEIISKLFKTK
ncbi:MAG: hypothetical protein LBJ09_03055 [Clostridiales bacterium]|jgi:uncharacterized membrane protein YkvI|nr:hypothetical protein [Clostridiales bacterium]